MYATAFNDKNMLKSMSKPSSGEQPLELKSRAKRNLAIMDEISRLIGDDIPWASEEEMIRELAEMRRRNSKS